VGALLPGVAWAALALPTAARAQESPYAGWEEREIKALSPEQIASLRTGEGMAFAFALAAELNGWPGPKHVLELADSLTLTPDQRSRIEAIRADMKERAVALGETVVTAEAELDHLFASRSITEASLAEKTAEIARLQGELRAVHLAAHLATTAVLTPHQIARYDALRGYATDHAAGDHVHE
jgi:Spy/CpxP family protein refolding chaperone